VTALSIPIAHSASSKVEVVVKKVILQQFEKVLSVQRAKIQAVVFEVEFGEKNIARPAAIYTPRQPVPRPKSVVIDQPRCHPVA
jgi:hypothetical protein